MLAGLALLSCLRATPVLAAGDAAVADPPAARGAMAPGLSATADGAQLIWLEPGGAQAVRLRTASYRHGLWSAAVTIVSRPLLVANWADTPVVAAAPDGALVATWAQTRAPGRSGYGLCHARSTDGGRTWAELGIVHDDDSDVEHGFASLAPLGAGLGVFWLDGRATAHQGPMALRVTTAGSNAAETSLVLDERVCDCCGTAAAAGSSGPVIAYRDRTADEIRDIWFVRRRGEGWSEPAPVHEDRWQITGCPVEGPAIAARGGVIAVAWFTAAGGRPTVKVAFSRDDGRSFDPPVEIDTADAAGGPFGRVAVALDDAANAVVFWSSASGSNRGPAIRCRRLGPTGKLGAPLEVARTSADRAAGFPRVVRVGEELLAVWTEAGEQTALRARRIPLANVPGLEGAVTSAAGDSPTPLPASVPFAANLPGGYSRSGPGGVVALDALRTGPVLVNFWATWCVPCRREMPLLAGLQQRFRPQGLTVVGIAVDDSAAAVADFVAKEKLPFAVALDSSEDCRDRFGVRSVPTTLLYDRHGKLVWFADGEIKAESPGFRLALGEAIAAD
ncbi:MAG: redoxin domain-containing protein [Candidatus Schekmanbacteria bacterium]|nr:redoxin domain-containing protein [Candidatus Schekmanbacteria bacterium]